MFLHVEHTTHLSYHTPKINLLENGSGDKNQDYKNQLVVCTFDIIVSSYLNHTKKMRKFGADRW